jgi:hypothetical protein
MTCTAASTQGMTSASIPLGTGNTLSFWVINTFTTNTGVDGRLLSYNALGQAHDYDNAASFNMARKGGNAPLQMVRNSVGMGFAADEPLTPVRLIGTIDSSGIMKYYVNGTLWQTSSASAGNWTTGGTAVVSVSTIPLVFIGTARLLKLESRIHSWMRAMSPASTPTYRSNTPQR